MKKAQNIPIMMFALLLLLSTIAYSDPLTTSFQSGLTSINSFFTGQYQPYSKAIDFFFFAFLFTAVYMMGARYAFKEMKRPEQVIVILLGLATAFLLVLRNISVTSLLPYIHWILYVLLFMLYWWMLKGIESKFWRFLLALLLTMLTIMLMQGLFNYLRAPEVPSVPKPNVGFGGFFKDFSLGFKPITLPKPNLPDFGFGKKDTTEKNVITETTTPEDKDKKPISGGDGSSPPDGKKRNWWWLLLLLLPLLAYLAYRYRGRLPFRKRGVQGRVAVQLTALPSGPVPLTIQVIIEEINRIIALKVFILKKIRDILKAKEAISGDFLKAYHETINDRAFLMDPDSQDHKTLMQRNDDAAKLLKLEMELEEELMKLREVEEELTTGSAAILKINLSKLKDMEKELKKNGSQKEDLEKVLLHIKETEEKLKLYKSGKGRILEWGEFIASRYGGKESGTIRTILDSSAGWYIDTLAKLSSTFRLLLDGNKGLLIDIKKIIAQFFFVAEKEESIEKLLKQLTDLHNLHDWLADNEYARWKFIQQKTPDQLIDHFQHQEKPYFENRLMPAVLWEMKYLRYIRYLLHFLEKDKMFSVDFKALKIESINADASWTDVTAQAINLPGAELGYLRISAEIEAKVQNEEPETKSDNAKKYDASCYVNGVKKVTKPVGIDSVIQFTSGELGVQFAPGKYVIDIEITNREEGGYTGRGTKSIVIYIKGIEMHKYLTLTPLNSEPDWPITIIAKYTAGKNKMRISAAPLEKLDNKDGITTQICLADTEIRAAKLSDAQFDIIFYSPFDKPGDKNPGFYLSKRLKKAILESSSENFKKNDEVVWLEGGEIIQLNEYKFKVKIEEFNYLPTLEEYKEQFPHTLGLPAKRRIKTKKILTLTPKNSNPARPIRIFGDYTFGKHKLRFTKERDQNSDVQICLASTKTPADPASATQFDIIFYSLFERFYLSKRHEKSTLDVKEEDLKGYNVVFLKDGQIIKLNEYEFEVSIEETTGALIDFEEYIRTLPVLKLGIPHKVLSLVPLNSEPSKKIDIISEYHYIDRDPNNGVWIGDSGNNHITLADSNGRLGTHSVINFYRSGFNEFMLVRKNDQVKIEIDNKPLDKPSLILKNNKIIKIDGYEFRIVIDRYLDQIPEWEEYRKRFGVVLLRTDIKIQIPAVNNFVADYNSMANGRMNRNDFRAKYGELNQIGMVHPLQWAVGETLPTFEADGKGTLMAYRYSDNKYAVVLWFDVVYSYAIHLFKPLQEVFDAINPDKIDSYHGTRIIRPSIFEEENGVWKIVSKGIIQSVPLPGEK